jgi:hypothetical protein
VGVAAAHGVAVDTASGDARPPAAFERLVQAEDERAGGQKRGHELAQQHVAGGAGAPPGPAQDSVVLVPAGLLAQAHDAQGRRDRAFAGGQDGPKQQELRVSEDAAGK